MPANDYVKLEQRLILAAWAYHQLGYTSNKAMLEDLREVQEGFSSSGRSNVLNAILARGRNALSRRRTSTTTTPTSARTWTISTNTSSKRWFSGTSNTCRY